LKGFPLLLLLSPCASPAGAEELAGRLVGFVEDARGIPVSGALISLFGKGLEDGGVLAVSDSDGRFALPALPAGSYTLRALGGRLRAQARQVTVLPNQESVFSVSLFASDADAEQDEADAHSQETPAQRELKWLVRHKRRSILEARGPEADYGTAPPRATLAVAHTSLPVEGALEVMTHGVASATAEGDDDAHAPGGLGLVRLGGRLGDSMSWSLGGLMSESEKSTWRMAAEFVVEPAAGHQVRTGAGYGSRWMTPFPHTIQDEEGTAEGRSVGVLFAEEQWSALPWLTVTAGGRYSYIGFLEGQNHLDPWGAVEFLVNPRTRIRADVGSRTLTPGGDLLTLSTLAASPAIAFATIDPGLRPERLSRYEVSVDHGAGPTRIGALVYYEEMRDPFLNTFTRSGRALRIGNVPSLSARGVGVTLGRRFGPAVEGSVTYSYGYSSGHTPFSQARTLMGALAYADNDFHDFVARFNAAIQATDTRLIAFCRFNSLSPDAEGPGTEGERTTRFDVQLSQGIPFLGDLTRADWELLLAYRNLFYETTEAGMLDELAVVNPPKRVLGGITVRF
jgi:hypothetical protein